MLFDYRENCALDRAQNSSHDRNGARGIKSFSAARVAAVAALALLTTVLLVAQSGPPTFTKRIIDSSIGGDVKIATDIDGDGYKDLVVGGFAGDNLNWYHYPSWTKTTIAVPSQEFTTDGAAGDIDGDGDMDIVVADVYGTNALQWLENPKIKAGGPGGNPFVTSQWIKRNVGNLTNFAKDIKLSDFDSNGLLDIAVRTQGEVAIYFQTSANAWLRRPLNVVNIGIEGMGSGDVDNDGDIDLIVRGAWLRNPGGPAAQTASSWSEHTIGAVHAEFKALVANIDGDAAQEVLFSSSEGTADVVWWDSAGGNPTGSWTGRTIAASVERAHTLQAADIDRDGDTDVVVGQMHTSSAKQLAVYYNQGGGLSWQKVLVDQGTGIHNGVVADIGNDGDWDIFGANWAGNPPVVLYEAGSAAPDTTPPSISAVNANSITNSSATISWTTNESATGRVEYGVSTAYGQSSPTVTNLTTSHSITLTGLAPSTIYYFRVHSSDAAANAAVSGQSSFTTTTTAPPPSTGGLSAHWKFDEGAGATGSDSSGNGNTGTLQGNPTWTAGHSSFAVNLNGSTQYVSAPNLDVSGSAITLAAWVRFSSFPSGIDQRIISKSTGASEADHYWMLSHVGGGQQRLRFRLKTGGTTTTLVATTGDLAANTWYHAAAVYDGSTMRLYLDGGLVGSSSKSGAISTNASVPVNIGRNPPSYGYLSGAVDDVRIYSEALSGGEILAIMNESPDSDTIAPERSNGSPSGSLPASTTSTAMSLTTSENATCKYSTTAGLAYASMANTFSATGGANHTTTVSGLATGQSYNYFVRCRDEAGNVNTNDFPISFSVGADSTSPSTPANLSAAAVSSTQINLSWQAANDNISVSGYRLYRNGTAIGTTAGLSYSNTGLQPSTTYTYNVSAYDAAGNESPLSSPATTSTSGAADTSPPVISSVAAANIGASSATITWNTNEAATGRVEYGLTASYGSTSPTNSNLTTPHSITLTGLSAATTYNYRVHGADAAGNAAASGNFTFTTQSAPSGGSGPVASWNLDESAGVTAGDSAGASAGTLTNGAAWTAGRYGGAVSLDGINDYISLPNLDVAGAGITMTAWVRFSSFPASSDQRILSKATSFQEQGHYWMLSQTLASSNSRLRFRLKTGSVTSTLIASSGNLAANTWYHVAATYDGAAMRLYLNGVEVGSMAKSGSVATSSTTPVSIGRNPDGSNFLSGAVDDVRIYNRGLSATDIAAAMNGN